jgi:hypothetical protein
MMSQADSMAAWKRGKAVKRRKAAKSGHFFSHVLRRNVT